MGTKKSLGHNWLNCIGPRVKYQLEKVNPGVKITRCRITIAFKLSIREGVNGKKTFSFGHCPNNGGGVYTCPNFLALFLEVHFWSIKRVYFFKNANVLNF